MRRGGRMKLFGYLPEELFHPLSGQKKHIYARILQRLYERIFDARVLETPTRDEVLTQIANALPEAGIFSAEQLEEEGVKRDPSSQAHSAAYRRLFETGWLVEEKEKWDTLVDMHPDAFMLISAISDHANNRIRVAGAVVEVKSNLEAAEREPEIMAQGLANAHNTAVRFARGMRRVLVSMRDIEERILGNPNAASILHTFFRDFVDGLLIADYKQLKTSNNPFRYRRHISSLASELIYDKEKRAKLARAYIDQGVIPPGSTFTDAEDRILKELEKIRQVFEDVGPFMERIEDFRDRLERRVRTTVHYMDIMGEGTAERIARLIEKASSNGADEIEFRLRSPDSGYPITSKALYTPPPPRTPPEVTRFKRPKRDPYLKAYVAATTAFDKRVRISPDRVLAFIEAKLGDKSSLHSSEIIIDTLDDFLAYRGIPSNAHVLSAQSGGRLKILLESDRTANDWINSQSFRIERIQPNEGSIC